MVTNQFLRLLVTKFWFLLLIIISIGIFILQKNDNNIYLYSRGKAVDFAAPVIVKVSDSFNFVLSVKGYFLNIINLYKDNERLKAENEKLEIYAEHFDKISSENRELKKILNYVEGKPEHKFTTRILVNGNSIISRTVIISAGFREGVYKGQIITNNKGLVGRVLEVNKKTSRVLLISDPNSRISIVTSKNRERAIAVGNGSNNLDMLYVREGAILEDNEVAFSSGDGDLIPYGILVGIVKKDGNKYIIKPFVDIDEVEYVSMIYSGD